MMLTFCLGINTALAVIAREASIFDTEQNISTEGILI